MSEQRYQWALGCVLDESLPVTQAPKDASEGLKWRCACCREYVASEIIELVHDLPTCRNCIDKKSGRL